MSSVSMVAVASHPHQLFITMDVIKVASCLTCVSSCVLEFCGTMPPHPPISMLKCLFWGGHGALRISCQSTLKLGGRGGVRDQNMNAEKLAVCKDCGRRTGNIYDSHRQASSSSRPTKILRTSTSSSSHSSSSSPPSPSTSTLSS